MGNILISGVFSKAGGFNAIEFYAVSEGDTSGVSGGDWCDYSLSEGGGMSMFRIDEFPACNNTITTGDFWRITDNQVAFSAYFGVAADYELTELSLFDGTKVVDISDLSGTLDRYGDNATTSWNYVDGWAYRNDGDDFGNAGAFVETNWSINQGAVATCSTNEECDCRFPLGTYSPEVPQDAPVCSLSTTTLATASSTTGASTTSSTLSTIQSTTGSSTSSSATTGSTGVSPSSTGASTTSSTLSTIQSTTTTGSSTSSSATTGSTGVSPSSTGASTTSSTLSTIQSTTTTGSSTSSSATTGSTGVSPSSTGASTTSSTLSTVQTTTGSSTSSSATTTGSTVASTSAPSFVPSISVEPSVVPSAVPSESGKPSLAPSFVPSTSVEPSSSPTKSGKRSGNANFDKKGKGKTSKVDSKSAKTAPSPPSPPTMMASSPEAEEDVAQDMDDTAKLLVGLLLDLFTKPDQAVGDTGMRDTLGGALMMILDLFKDYKNDGGRRGLRAATASKEDMEKLETKLIKVLNELRE